MPVVLAALLALAAWLIYDGLTRPAPGARDPDAPPPPPSVLDRLKDAAVPPGVPGLPFLALSMASALALGALAALLTGWPLLVAAAVVGGLVLPGWALRRRARRRREARREALPDALEQLRALVQGGVGVPEALALLADAGPPALRADFALLRLDLRLAGLAEALRRAQARWDDSLFSRAADALALSDRLGGQYVGRLLEDLAAAARAEAGARAEGKAKQAEMILTSRVVALLPLGGLLLLRQANPVYVEPYATPQGQLVLGLVLGLMAAGYWLMLRAARLPGEEERAGRGVEEGA